jgi:hypothetical protein
MELGSGRLVAQDAYRDVTRAFTGVKLRWDRAGRGALTAFAVLPVLTLPDDRDGLLHNRMGRDREHLNQKFWGALYERERIWRGIRGELYLYALREHDHPGARPTRDRALWTPGIRLYRNATAGTWDLDLETMWQRGRAQASSAPTDARPLDVNAHYLHLHTGYTFEARGTPRVAVEYDYGSGDSDPADGKWNRFDALFGNRRVDLGPTSIYGALGRENIETVGLRVSVAPTARLDSLLVYRVVRLAAAADAFASTGVRDPLGRSGRDGAQQIDARLRTWIVPGAIRLDVGATHLIAGRFLRRAPNATQEGNTTFLYGDVTYTFGSKQGS